jgi:hypothetical protein
VLCNINSGVKGNVKNGFGVLDNRGQCDEPFLRRMLKPLREGRIWLPGPVVEGLTDLYVHRVICNTGKDGVGVELRAGK